MPPSAPGFELRDTSSDSATLVLLGDWVQGQPTVPFHELRTELAAAHPHRLVVDAAGLDAWDSVLLAFLLQCHNYCVDENIDFDPGALPDGVARLLRLATTVPPHRRAPEARESRWHPMRTLRGVAGDIAGSLAFLGDLGVALLRLISGRANTRFSDFRTFCYQAGPNAFAIISLTSVLVGMILAYLGAVQLQMFGAEIYVADLVLIGMLREMGVLMTAVVMAGRTGAAYAAQLGTMQTNEEIDAVTTMGVSPMEFLVVPRVLALLAMLPLLTLYANLLGVCGGAIVAGGMGISLLQYMNQIEAAMSLTHLWVGLSKSFVFAILIAIAGCRSGIQSGRGSAAVGDAATEAVVTALIYLIVADAAFNIMFQHLGI